MIVVPLFLGAVLGAAAWFAWRDLLQQRALRRQVEAEAARWVATALTGIRSSQRTWERTHR